MTDKDKIRKEAERLREQIQNKVEESDFISGEVFIIIYFLTFIDSLQEDPVNNDLEEAIDTYLKSYWGGEKEKQEWPFLKKMVIYFVKWQKEQMMANATDVTVHIDAGGYPYIPEIELYDYDKDIPLAKEGDKYKVVLIKED